MSNFPRSTGLPEQLRRMAQRIYDLERRFTSYVGPTAGTLLTLGAGVTGDVTVYRRGGVAIARVEVTTGAGGLGAFVPFATVPTGLIPATPVHNVLLYGASYTSFYVSGTSINTRKAIPAGQQMLGEIVWPLA